MSESIITYSTLGSEADVSTREYTTGDPVVSFEHLYLTYKNAIFKHLLGKVSRWEIAEELSQETWLKVWRYYPPQHTKNLYAWLLTIASRTAIDAYRFGHLRIEQGEILSLDVLDYDGEDKEAANMEERVANRELRQQAFKQLPLDYQCALGKHFAGKPHNAGHFHEARRLYKQIRHEQEVAS